MSSNIPGTTFGDFSGQMVTQFRGVVDIGKTFRRDTIFDPDVGSAAFPLRIRLDGDTGDISVGGFGQDGDLTIRSATNVARIHFDGTHANGWFGGNGADGDIILFPSQADDLNDLSQATIHLDGQAGDITLRNADFAEDFDIDAAAPEVEPGTVLVLTDDGALIPSAVPYDTKVAGVVSGASNCRPGIIMDKRGDADNRLPVALVGKVYCKIDAEAAPVAVGDLLTTSATIGHAMKAADRGQAFGAVIGKALRPLAAGRGLIPILVALQ